MNDKQIATKLADAMELKLNEDGVCWVGPGILVDGSPPEWHYEFDPITRWDHVGIIIDWLELQGKSIYIEENKSSRRIRFGENEGITQTYGGSLPRQICLAALKGLESEITCEEYHKCTCETDGIPAGEHIAGCIESGSSSRADPQAYSTDPRKCDNCGVEVGSWAGLVKHVKGEVG